MRILQNFVISTVFKLKMLARNFDFQNWNPIFKIGIRINDGGTGGYWGILASTVQLCIQRGATLQQPGSSMACYSYRTHNTAKQISRSPIEIAFKSDKSCVYYT